MIILVGFFFCVCVCVFPLLIFCFREISWSNWCCLLVGVLSGCVVGCRVYGRHWWQPHKNILGCGQSTWSSFFCPSYSSPFAFVPRLALSRWSLQPSFFMSSLLFFLSIFCFFFFPSLFCYFIQLRTLIYDICLVFYV